MPLTLREINEADLSSADWRVMDLINRHQTQLGWPYGATLDYADTPQDARVNNGDYGPVKMFSLDVPAQKIYLFVLEAHRAQFVLDSGALAL
jgi:hypothetical protein